MDKHYETYRKKLVGNIISTTCLVLLDWFGSCYYSRKILEQTERNFQHLSKSSVRQKSQLNNCVQICERQLFTSYWHSLQFTTNNWTESERHCFRTLFRRHTDIRGLHRCWLITDRRSFRWERCRATIQVEGTQVARWTGALSAQVNDLSQVECRQPARSRSPGIVRRFWHRRAARPDVEAVNTVRLLHSSAIQLKFLDIKSEMHLIRFCIFNLYSVGHNPTKITSQLAKNFIMRMLYCDALYWQFSVLALVIRCINSVLSVILLKLKRNAMQCNSRSTPSISRAIFIRRFNCCVLDSYTIWKKNF